MARPRYDVFLSYSHRDRDLVQGLVQLLNAGGNRAFWDGDLEPGDPWKERLERIIAGCKVVVVCWCCDSADSGMVAEEIRLALANGKKLVPVRFCRAILASPISSRQWIDLSASVIHSCRAVEHEPTPDGAAPRTMRNLPDAPPFVWPGAMNAVLFGLILTIVVFVGGWAYALLSGGQRTAGGYVVFVLGLGAWLAVGARWLSMRRKLLDANRANQLAYQAWRYFMELRG